jgi:hypothetical protein
MASNEDFRHFVARNTSQQLHTVFNAILDHELPQNGHFRTVTSYDEVDFRIAFAHGRNNVHEKVDALSIGHSRDDDDVDLVERVAFGGVGCEA